MHEKTLALLEFPVIRSRVAEAALSAEAAARIADTLPCIEARETAALKALVSQMRDRIDSGDEEPRGSIPDIGPLLPRLEVDGASLELDEAYALGLFAGRGDALKRWILATVDKPVTVDKPAANALEALALALPDPGGVFREVFRVLDQEGRLRDLSEFREIKRRIQGARRDLEAALASYTTSGEYTRMLQSAVPSQRDGRTVLALKANFRGRIRGIIHEVSTTGQTIFLEPEDVVERNNDILLLERQLAAEIRRVLREMTSKIAGYREVLADFHTKLIYLETIRARARYSRDIGGCFARQDDSVLLAQARHPLLGGRAVPIDFAMNRDTRTVIITGPNTGGKTLSLKTLGLLALMNQFGLALPAGEGTGLPVFDGVYADIGDEQSLSQSLSTFSAHMTNIAAIAAVAGEDSLVLLDELGSGTDPQEGSAIAMAILDHIGAKAGRIIATTHHGALKNYGYTRAGVENASVEFDGATLSPTYRIVMGIPGESRAVDIAARNKVPAEIIAGARSYLAGERSDISALIAELEKKRRDLDEAFKQNGAEEARLREERRRADLRELRLRQQELGLKEGGMGHFRQLLAESRKLLENLVRELREGEISREKTHKVKDFLKDLEEQVKTGDELLESEARQLAGETARLEPAAGGPAAGPAGGPARGPAGGSLPIEPGAEVLAGPYGRRGRVLRQDRGSPAAWIVEIGSLKMSFSETELRALPPSREPPKPLIAAVDLTGDHRPQARLTLRGMRLDEALEALGKQIDAAVLGGLGEFAVIHGKGDGILQKGVHDFLKQQSQVADYYFSRPELGGFGRTEVILKRE